MVDVHEGLEGIYFTRTAISKIYGDKGKLAYRGYFIEDLARRSTFEEVIYLLWFGELPSQEQFQRFRRGLMYKRIGVLTSRYGFLEKFASNLPSMDMLRTATSHMPQFFGEDDPRQMALSLVAAFPIMVAAHERMRKGIPVVYPNCNMLGHAANFLYMLKGEIPTEEEEKIFDRALILHAEHGAGNASSFTCRVITSTQSDLYSAIAGAIGALKGPRHGGANERAMELFETIASRNMNENEIRAYILKKLGNKERIPGFGHRVYHVLDPRANILRKDALKLLKKRGGDFHFFEIAETIRRVVEQEKAVYPNVDFYSGLLYYALGIPKELFTPIFAISRVPGWIAHAFEQADPQKPIIRPSAEYIGPPPRKYPKERASC